MANLQNLPVKLSHCQTSRSRGRTSGAEFLEEVATSAEGSELMFSTFPTAGFMGSGFETAPDLLDVLSKSQLIVFFAWKTLGETGSHRNCLEVCGCWSSPLETVSKNGR